MNSKGPIMLAAATILLMTVLQPARANTQRATASADQPRANPAQSVVNGGRKPPGEAKAAQVMAKLLPDIPGKEVVVLTVTYPPGHSGAVHRHNADGFIYVLEGSVEMGVNGRTPVTLGPGQTFYEGPDDVHTVGRNASKTKSAKLLVLLIKDKGAPTTVPVK